MSPKGRQTLGTGGGGHAYSRAFWLCFLPTVAPLELGRCQAPGGPLPRGSFSGGTFLFPAVLGASSAAGALFSQVSLPLFPGPALPSGHPEQGGVSSQPWRGLSPPQPAVSSALAACGGAGPASASPPSYHSPARGRCLWQRVGGERSAQDSLDPETRPPEVGRKHSGLAGPRGSTQTPVRPAAQMPTLTCCGLSLSEI